VRCQNWEKLKKQNREDRFSLVLNFNTTAFLKEKKKFHTYLDYYIGFVLSPRNFFNYCILPAQNLSCLFPLSPTSVCFTLFVYFIFQIPICFLFYIPTFANPPQLHIKLPHYSYHFSSLFWVFLGRLHLRWHASFCSHNK
jgi:hypothetical protein